MSHTVSAQTTDYTWDVAAGLPLVLQDVDNTYVYGLDLISATDGAGVQTYFLYDGHGSTTDLTDGSGNVVVTGSFNVIMELSTAQYVDASTELGGIGLQHALYFSLTESTRARLLAGGAGVAYFGVRCFQSANVI